MRDLKMRYQTAEVENAGLENAGPSIMESYLAIKCANGVLMLSGPLRSRRSHDSVRTLALIRSLSQLPLCTTRSFCASSDSRKRGTCSRRATRRRWTMVVVQRPRHYVKLESMNTKCDEPSSSSCPSVANIRAAFSSPAIFHPCSLVPHFQVSHFQRPRHCIDSEYIQHLREIEPAETETDKMHSQRVVGYFCFF